MRLPPIPLYRLSAATALADDASNHMSGVSTCFDIAAKAGVRDCVWQASNLCRDKMPDGFSTLGMAKCNDAEAEAWDTILNQEYEAALKVAKSIDDSVGPSSAGNAAEPVRVAQRTRLALRDAQCKMDHAPWGGGTMRLIAAGDCLEKLMAQRALESLRWQQIEPGEQP